MTVASSGSASGESNDSSSPVRTPGPALSVKKSSLRDSPGAMLGRAPSENFISDGSAIGTLNGDPSISFPAYSMLNS